MRMTPRALARHRERQWQRLQPIIARTPALAGHEGKPLAEFPIVSTADLRADYGAWNSCAKSDAELRNLADSAEAGTPLKGDLSAGWSTGSGGGQRGLFLANEAERADYIGQSLARLLPARALLKRQRLALHLRASNALYSDVSSGRFAFTHIPLEVSPDETIRQLHAFAPTILIAPPNRLLALARSGHSLPSLDHLFCGSEPISESERETIEQGLGLGRGLRPRSIYQATEGFIAAECQHGRLHLNEHAIEVELERVSGTAGYRPIFTDLRRKSQPIVRLRGDDFIELADDQSPCPCGYGGRVIKPPQGRVTDLWRFEEGVVTPSQVVEAVEAQHASSGEWQAIARRAEVILRIASGFGEAQAREAASRLQHLTHLPIQIASDLTAWTEHKRRKVVWADG
ncbi:MAG: hypothetical protein AAFO28_01780 [Pseudomonadota bacterium]